MSYLNSERGGKLSVVMFGARMHYAVPNILHQAGKLHFLYNDLNVTSRPVSFLRHLPTTFLPASLKRLKARNPAPLPVKKSRSSFTLGLNHWLKLRYATSFSETVHEHERAARELADFSLRHGLVDGDCSFTYDRAGLEVMQHMRNHGKPSIMEQTVAPANCWKQLLTRSDAPLPADENTLDALNVLSYREKQEWALASQILCGSEYVASSLISLGVASHKCYVVPYGVRPPSGPKVPKSYRGDRRLRCLFIGEVGYRKGANDALSAAKLLRDEVEFTFAGGIVHTEIYEPLDMPNLRMLGVVPRTEVANLYEWADVFVLPSLLEGSATVTYEALSHGVPVVCTYETGSVVKHDFNGLIVEGSNPRALAAAINKLRAPGEVERLSSAALSSSELWSFTAYSRRFLTAIQCL